MSGPLAQMVRTKYPGAYDDLSDEQLEQAIVAKYPGVYDDLLSPPEQPRSEYPHARVGRAVTELAKGPLNVIKEIPAGLFGERGIVTNLPGAVQGMVEAQGRVGMQAKEAFDQGDYLTAARKGVNYLMPVLGPALDASTDKMMQGDVWEGIGEAATTAYLTALGGRPRPATVTKPPRLSGPANVKEAAAVKFAQQEGVPLDAGTATGSNFLKTVQEKSANTYGGAQTAERLRLSQTENLTRVGTEQAGKAFPQATNPVAAGEAVLNRLTAQIQRSHQVANEAYTRFRSGTQGVTMDTRPSKQALRPIYDRLMRENQVVPLQGGKGKALVALDRFMNSPDLAPIADVDAALGDFKALARGAEMPELRSAGQGVSARAVLELDAQVRGAAAKAGAEVLKALEEGRAATKQKYAVADVMDMLSGEPGQVYRQLTQNKDVGLERLKAVQRVAPQELPRVGRAFLEDMIQQATAEGGWAHTDRLWSDWNKLGGETKARLFSKQQIQDLDNFFLLGKRIGEVKNPSGTAKVAGVLDVFTGLPSYALAKMLLTPSGVKWLTQARVVSRNPSSAARAVAITNITKAAQSAGVPLEVIPALGEDEQTPRPSQTRTPGVRR